MLATVGVLCAVVSVSACGGDDAGSTDAAIADARPPDARQKPDAADPCIDYCECMPTNCPSQFQSVLGGTTASCMADCAGLLKPENKSCRAYHCSVAVGTEASMHCPHAIGMGGFCME
jgi:hypothetical protein